LCSLSLSLSLILSLSLASRPIFPSAKNSPVRRDRTRPLPLRSPPIRSRQLAKWYLRVMKERMESEHVAEALENHLTRVG
jgi:hypothetical protein